MDYQFVANLPKLDSHKIWYWNLETTQWDKFLQSKKEDLFSGHRNSKPIRPSQLKGPWVKLAVQDGYSILSCLMYDWCEEPSITRDDYGNFVYNEGEIQLKLTLHPDHLIALHNKVQFEFFSNLKRLNLHGSSVDQQQMKYDILPHLCKYSRDDCKLLSKTISLRSCLNATYLNLMTINPRVHNEGHPPIIGLTARIL